MRVEKKGNFDKIFPKIMQKSSKFISKNFFLSPDGPLVNLGLFLEVLCGSAGQKFLLHAGAIICACNEKKKEARMSYNFSNFSESESANFVNSDCIIH